MKYLPLIASALWRRPTETVFTFLAITAGFILFASMMGLNVTYQRAIEGAPDDRLFVVSRFPGTLNGLPIGLEEPLRRIPGVASVGAWASVCGHYGAEQKFTCVFTADEGMQAAFPFPIDAVNWKLLMSTVDGVLVSHKSAQALDLKMGDVLTLGVTAGFRGDGASSWPFKVIGIVPDSPASTRASGFNSVVVRLETPGAFPAFARWVGANPALAVSAERQVQFYLRSVNPFMEFFTSLAFFIATVLAVGALFGSLNVMYGRVRARTREIITLRVLGFGALPIAVSVLTEALLLSLAGAAVGVASAWLLFSGRHGIAVHTAYQLSFTAHLMLVGFAWAVTIGMVGSLLPTIRAVRLPMAAGLRDAATL
jgi:ABC-type lipoprotein release transport system permease subunit